MSKIPTSWLNSSRNNPVIVLTTRAAPFKALVLRLLDKQNDIEQVARQTLVPIRTLYTWLEQWNQQKKTLTNQSSQHSGRPTALADNQRMAFVEYLHAQPRSHRRPADPPNGAD